MKREGPKGSWARALFKERGAVKMAMEAMWKRGTELFSSLFLLEVGRRGKEEVINWNGAKLSTKIDAWDLVYVTRCGLPTGFLPISMIS